MIPILQTIAPTVAKLLTSSVGDAITSKIKDKLGVDSLPEKLEPKDIAAIRELEAELIKELYSKDVEDRNSARIYNKEDNTPKMLAYIVTLGFFSLLVLHTYSAVPQESANIMNIMIGSLGTAWVSIINYYFGSSLGSRMKTNMISKPE